MDKIDSRLFFYIQVNSRETIEKMTTPVLYSKITKGEDLDKVTTPEQLEAKKNFVVVSNYTKMVRGNMQTGASSITLTSTYGVIVGQPITGNGIDEYTFITAVDYNTNTVTVGRPAIGSGSNISIIINSYPDDEVDDEYEGPIVFNYKYPTHVDLLQEDFNQNY
jgi:hypothetical protein